MKRCNDRLSSPHLFCGGITIAVATTKLITTFRPKLIVIAGICAGVRKKTEIGDILIADPCFDWGSGKWIKNKETKQAKFLPAAYPWRLDESLRIAAKTVGEKHGLLEKIHADYQQDKPQSPPKLIIDAMASGASVLQATTIMEGVREQHKNLVGIEMESYAVFTAAEYSTEPRPKCMAIKAVCDFGDEKKSDEAHEYAAYVSANFLLHFATSFIKWVFRVNVTGDSGRT